MDPTGHEVRFQYQDEIEFCIQYGLYLDQEWVDTFCASVDTWNMVSLLIPWFTVPLELDTEIYRVDMSNRDLIIADAISLASDVWGFIPQLGWGPWVASTIASGYSAAMTDYYYNRRGYPDKGITSEDVSTSRKNFLWGMIPYFGTYFSLDALTSDMNLTGGPWTNGHANPIDIAEQFVVQVTRLAVNQVIDANMDVWDKYHNPWLVFPEYGY